MHKRWLITGLLLLILAVLAGVTDRTLVVVSGNITFSPDSRQHGDVILIAGNLVQPAGARIDGTLGILCCNGDVNGTVAGDLYLVTGNLRLRSMAAVGGELGTTSANVQRDPGATVGRTRAGMGFWLTLLRAVALAPLLGVTGLLTIVIGLFRTRRRKGGLSPMAGEP